MLAIPFLIVLVLALVAGAVNHYRRNAGYGEARLLGKIVSYSSVIGVFFLFSYAIKTFSSYRVDSFFINIFGFAIVVAMFFGFILYKVYQYAYRRADKKRTERHEILLCNNCGGKVEPIRNMINHSLHMLMMLFTSGFWCFVWYGLLLNKGKSWKCPECEQINN